jgi:hypothetical protein
MVLCTHPSHALTVGDWLSLNTDEKNAYIKGIMDWWAWEYVSFQNEKRQTANTKSHFPGAVKLGKCVLNKPLTVAELEAAFLSKTKPQRYDSNPVILFWAASLSLCHNFIESQPKDDLPKGD